MRSPITKLAVAAAVVLVAIAAVSLWRGTESGVALADVLAKVEQAQAFMYRMKMHMEGPIQNMPSTSVDMEGTVLIATEYGMRMDMHMADPNKGIDMRQQMYMLPNQNMLIMLMPEMKRYMRMEVDESMIEKMRQQNNDPRLMIKQIMSCEYEELGRSEIDGIEAEGFHTTDSAYAGGMFGDVAVTLWVDAKTRLPVRVEMDMKMNEQIQMQGTLYDFQWDVPVAASEFEDVIPADFSAGPGDGIRVPAMTEETAIEGLRVALTYIGRYPKNLNMMTLMEMMGEFREGRTPEAKELLEELKGIDSDQDKGAKMVEMMVPIQAIGGFYAMLVQEQKDPAYYGEIATPGDIAQVLLRWKTADGEYRVVFADLHAETVTAEQLAQLEAALPE